MPRTKTAKRTSKRQNARDSMNHYQKLEKEFLGIPGKFAGQVKKDILTHKQKEQKLKAAWNKNKDHLKTVESRIKAVAKNKNTSTGKKQWNTFKKAHTEALRNHTGLKK